MDTDLWKVYELNEKYHDSKENRIWLAIGIYFTFSIAIIKWILEKSQDAEIITYSFFIIFFLSIVFLLFLGFILLQMKMKWNSTIDSFILQEELFNNIEKPSIKKIYEIAKEKAQYFKVSGRRYNIFDKHIFDIIQMEIPLLLLTIISFALQILLIFSILYRNVISGLISLHWYEFLLLFLIFLTIGTFLGLVIASKNKKIRLQKFVNNSNEG